MTAGPGTPIECSNPLDAAMLTDYWLALLPPSEEERVEEHLLTCDECGDRLREVIAFSDALRMLAKSPRTARRGPPSPGERAELVEPAREPQDGERKDCSARLETTLSAERRQRAWDRGASVELGTVVDALLSKDRKEPTGERTTIFGTGPVADYVHFMELHTRHRGKQMPDGPYQ
jgi:hypothetical protein